MLLEGVVTNVANFGAFVDVGVHQDGMVHVSQLADRFVKDPREVVKAGDIVKVKVVEVDLKRRRIALTMKLQDPQPGAAARPNSGAAGAPAGAAGEPASPAGRPSGDRPKPVQRPAPAPSTSMAAAFGKLRRPGS
jgi:uncharacterized protein